MEKQINKTLKKSFWVDGEKCPKSDEDSFWKDKGIYAILNDLRPKNDSEILQEKLGVSKEQVRHVRDIFAFKPVDHGSDFRFNVFGTQYAVKDKEFVVTYKGEVLEVGSSSYDSFMKEASYAGRIWEPMFGKVNVRQKLFITPKNIPLPVAYAALDHKLPEVLKIDESK